jgi:alcohol dehydrogenase
VTVPFVGGCGQCRTCWSGNPQVCADQYQPGFSDWGTFAEYVSIDYADANLVELPEGLDPITAASLGCRFTTAFRAVVDQSGARGGDWVVVHGCGGVRLSAVMIADSIGAQVIAVDISKPALRLAETVGAQITLNPREIPDIVDAVRDHTNGGAHVSIDALGSPETCYNSIAGLRSQGRHLQIGLPIGDHAEPSIPMDQVVAKELDIRGTHGIPSYRYPAVLDMINTGRLDPNQLVRRTIPLSEGATALTRMDENTTPGVTVIEIPDNRR